MIPESHWLNPALWFDLKTGDVVQERDWDEDDVDYHRFDDGRENYAVRWRATMLIRTGQKLAFTVHTCYDGRLDEAKADRNQGQ